MINQQKREEAEDLEAHEMAVHELLDPDSLTEFEFPLLDLS